MHLEIPGVSIEQTTEVESRNHQHEAIEQANADKEEIAEHQAIVQCQLEPDFAPKTISNPSKTLRQSRRPSRQLKIPFPSQLRRSFFGLGTFLLGNNVGHIRMDFPTPGNLFPIAARQWQHGSCGQIVVRIPGIRVELPSLNMHWSAWHEPTSITSPARFCLVRLTSLA